VNGDLEIHDATLLVPGAPVIITGNYTQLDNGTLVLVVPGTYSGIQVRERYPRRKKKVNEGLE
jgi:hypothetical protein